jgi:hypothetical protein
LYFLATELLREKFAEMKDGHIRVVVVVIENGLNIEFRRKKELFFRYFLEKLISKGEHNAERTFNEGSEKNDLIIINFFVLFSKISIK